MAYFKQPVLARNEALYPECFRAVTYDKLNELHMLDAADDNPLLPENLPDEIHPLFEFSPDRWLMPNAAQFHTAYRTGLKIASYLLETDKVISWFTKACFSVRRRGTAPSGAKRTYLGNLPPDKDRKFYKDSTRMMLRRWLVPYVYFAVLGELEEGRRTYGSCATYLANLVQVPIADQQEWLQRRCGYGVGLRFHPDFCAYGQWSLGADGDSNSPSVALDMRCQLLFAFTLLHEFAHAVETLRFSHPSFPEGQGVQFSDWNVYYDLDVEHNEWGYQLEHYIAGVTLSSEVGLPDVLEPFEPIPQYGFFGIKKADWEQSAERVDWDYELMSMEWVNFWFREENLRMLEQQDHSVLPSHNRWYVVLTRLWDTFPWEFALLNRDADHEPLESSDDMDIPSSPPPISNKRSWNDYYGDGLDGGGEGDKDDDVHDGEPPRKKLYQSPEEEQ